MEQTRIVKGCNLPEAGLRRRISAAEWMGAERAEALVASAEAEATAVRAAAGEVRATAEREGHAAGLLAGAEQIRARLAELAEVQAAWQARAETDAVELALEMARRILGRELRADPAAALAGAGEALRVAGPVRRMRVRLHPEAVAQLRQQSPALAAQVEGRTLELVSDPGLLPGDVVVETEAGQVDGRVERRLEHFRAALAKVAA